MDLYFPPSEGVDIIAEPGRFYAASAFTLATNIHSKRETQNHAMYYINDGVYGSFNCIFYDHAVVSPQPFVVSYSYFIYRVHIIIIIFIEHGKTYIGLKVYSFPKNIYLNNVC